MFYDLNFTDNNIESDVDLVEENDVAEDFSETFEKLDFGYVKETGFQDGVYHIHIYHEEETTDDDLWEITEI